MPQNSHASRAGWKAIAGWLRRDMDKCCFRMGQPEEGGSRGCHAAVVTALIAQVVSSTEHLAQGSESLWHLAWYSLASAGKRRLFPKGSTLKEQFRVLFSESHHGIVLADIVSEPFPPPAVRIRAGVNFNHPPFLSALATFPKRAPSKSIGFYLLVYVSLSLPLPLPMSHEYA